MEDKTQYEALVEELQKIVENFKVGFTEIGEILSKILPDVEIPDEEEDTWEMKCPYKNGDDHFVLYDDGAIGHEKFLFYSEDNGRFEQGNLFLTREAAELEAKRRNLLTRFRAFRDECNGDWEPDFSDDEEKYYLYYSILEECIDVGWIVLGCSFNLFGYFKNQEDAERAIELFGNEIIELYVEKRLANENN